MVIAVLLLVILSGLSLATGPARLNVVEVLEGIVGTNEISAIIVRELRLPRLLLASGVGAVLGLGGAAVQGLTRNPLAEPAILGAPQAAAFGAVLVLYTGLVSALSFAVPLAGICFAALSLVAILAVVRVLDNVLTLVLVGLAMGSLAGALTSLVISLSANPFAVMEIVFWLMGSFEDRSFWHVIMAYPFFLLGGAVLLACGPAYRALSLGEDVARTIGVDISRLSLFTAAGIAISTGAGVAVSGAIGFVGLVAPHLARPFCGPDPAGILLPSALSGAVIVVAADIAVRVIPATSEIRVGVLTAIIGVPWFIYLVISHQGFFLRSR